MSPLSPRGPASSPRGLKSLVLGLCVCLKGFSSPPSPPWSQASPCFGFHVSSPHPNSDKSQTQFSRHVMVSGEQMGSPTLASAAEEGFVAASLCCGRREGVLLCAPGMNSGKEAGAKHLFQGGSAHSLHVPHAGLVPCQVEADTQIRTRHLEDSALSARRCGLMRVG